MAVPTLQALLFDVDGTLADTEDVHRQAFNQAFEALGLAWHWDVALYTRLLEVSGGKERMLHYWTTHHPGHTEIAGMAPAAALQQLHNLKTDAYTAAVHAGKVALRPGVLSLLESARHSDLQLAIATTTSPANIAALLQHALGAQWKRWFAAIGDAQSAPLKKPHPQVYLQTLDALRLPAAACIAFEDSFNGLRASTAAHLATIITPTPYTADHDFAGAMKVIPDLTHVDLQQLQRWHHAPNLTS